MARLRDVIFDCRHPASLARFWAAVLDEYEVAPYDKDELERLRSMGILDPEDDPTVLVERLSGASPRLWFQRVPEGKVVKNRVHIDVEADHVDAELERLLALGAALAPDQANDGLFVLLDLEGNEFCLLR
jgi:Glyoxalase-like domain